MDIVIAIMCDNFGDNVCDNFGDENTVQRIATVIQICDGTMKYYMVIHSMANIFQLSETFRE